MINTLFLPEFRVIEIVYFVSVRADDSSRSVIYETNVHPQVTSSTGGNQTSIP